MVLAAVGQLTSRGVIRDNLRKCCSIISRAADVGAKVVFLPEASDFIAASSQVLSLTPSGSIEEAEFVTGIRDQAQKSKVWVSVGVHEKSPSPTQCYNTNLLISSDGTIQKAYRKIHLFDVDIKGLNGLTILESSTTLPGSMIEEPVETPIGKVGLLTCYDLRFPEQSLILRRRGAQILTYPSAFTVRTGAAHWEPLLRARATETQTYIFAAAQIGSHSPHKPSPSNPPNKRISYGSAMIVDPWGTVLARCNDDLARHEGRPAKIDGEEDDEGEGTFAVADVDLDYLEKVRREMPLWSQRREDVYPTLR